MSDFTVKDSGVREEYANGFVRDTEQGKLDYTLLPLEFLTRWAAHMTKGAEKYGRDNWRQARGIEAQERFQRSAMRHMMQWLAGDRDEDHAAAVAFNVAAAEYVREQLDTSDSGSDGGKCGGKAVCTSTTVHLEGCPNLVAQRVVYASDSEADRSGTYRERDGAGAHSDTWRYGTFPTQERRGEGCTGWHCFRGVSSMFCEPSWKIVQRDWSDTFPWRREA